MLDTSVLPSDSLIPTEGASLEEIKNSKISSSQPRKVKKLRDRSAHIPKRPDFTLYGDKHSYQLPDYNGLKDEHLIGHFYNKKLRKLLKKNGLISRGGRVVEAKTCLNQAEMMKQTLNDSGVSFKSVKGGTMILSVKLPKIDPSTVPESKKTRRRASSAAHPDYHSVDAMSRAGTPLNPVDCREKLNMTDIKFHEVSTMDNSFSNGNSSSVEFYSAQLNRSGYSSRKNSDRTTRKKAPRPAPTTVLKDLKPMTKDDLRAAIERQKHKINETVIVDESPELNQPISASSSQRIIEEQIVPQLSTPSRLDSRQKSSPHKEKTGAQETGRAASRKGSAREKLFTSTKRTDNSSLTHSPLTQELPLRPYQEAVKNHKIKAVRPLDRSFYKEKSSPLEKSMDLKSGFGASMEPTKLVETPAKNLKNKNASPTSRNSTSRSPVLRAQQTKDEKEIEEKIQEGSQSPTQKNISPKAPYESNRSPKRQSSSRQSTVRPNSRAQEDRGQKRKETDPMNRDLVRQSTHDQDVQEQGQIAEEIYNKSPKREPINRARTVRPSTSSKAQEDRSFRKKNTEGGQEKDLMRQSMQHNPNADGSRKRLASAGGESSKDEKKKFKMKLPGTTPSEVVAAQNEKTPKELSQLNNSPSQKNRQEQKTQEVASMKLETKRSSRSPLQQVAGPNKSQKEDKKLRLSSSSSSNLNQSVGKLKSTTPEKKPQLHSKNTFEEPKNVEQSPDNSEKIKNKEAGINEITAALFGSALNMVQPLEMSFMKKIKEAFYQRSLASEPASRQTSQSPTKDVNKSPKK